VSLRSSSVREGDEGVALGQAQLVSTGRGVAMDLIADVPSLNHESCSELQPANNRGRGTAHQREDQNWA
jgi:hypothetical protein